MDWWISAILLTIVFLTSGHKFTCTPSVEQMLGHTLRPHWRGESAFALLLVIALVSLARVSALPLGYQDLFFYAGMGWLLLAVSWADDQLRSLRRTVQFGICAFAALILASVYDFDDRVSIIAFCAGMFIILELIDGAFQGRLTDEKTRRFGRTVLPNRQAINAFLVLLSVIYFVESGKISAFLGLGLIIPTLLLLLLTQARAATWAGFLGIVVWSIVAFVNPQEEASWFILILPGIYLLMIALVFLFLVPKHPKSTKMQSLVHLGRKPSELKNLNQRKPLWIYTLRTARKRWILGHGYGSFWTPARSEQALSWKPSNAHSCYLDIFASTGIVGLLILFGFFWGLMVTTLDAPSPERQFIFALTCFVALIAGMESKFWLGDFDTFAFLIFVLNSAPRGVNA